jgi:hypothetical protein
MLPSGARSCTQALPLSSCSVRRISIPLDRSSLAAALTSSTRKPATGPVVKCRLTSLSDPKTSTLLPSGNFNTRNPGRSSSDRRPRISRKKSTVDWKLSVRVPSQASLMIFTSVQVRALAQGVNWQQALSPVPHSSRLIRSEGADSPVRDEGLYRSRELGALLAVSTPPAYWCCR